jgi:hypothetical protein
LVEVAVVNNIEVVAAEDIFQFTCTLSIHLHFIAEIVLFIAGCTHHGCHSVLG